MKREYAWPPGHWNWPIKVSHKHGVRSGQMIWVGGQVDLTSTGEVRNQGNLAAQVPNCIRSFERVLAELGAGLLDVVKLLCFYVNDGTVNEREFLRLVASALPPGARPAITAIPVAYLAYPGMVAEIEGYAMRAEDGMALPRQIVDKAPTPLPAPFVQAVRCGKMIFVSGQTPVDEQGKLVLLGDIVGQTGRVMRQIEQLLAEFGAGFDDVVKVNR